jgi:hypothetical protein
MALDGRGAAPVGRAKCAAFPEFPSPGYAALLSGDVEDYHDAEGRPIGEIRASPRARTANTRYVACPFGGSRRGSLPINASALDQVKRTWPQIIGTLGFIREAWLRRFPSAELTVLGLARLTQAYVLLSPYLSFRARTPFADGTIPVPIASIHKMSVGLVGACQHILFEGLLAGEARDQVATPKLVHGVSERAGLLIGTTGTEVCAGPPGMIMEAFELIISGKSRTPQDRSLAQDLLGGELDAFLDYADQAISVSSATLAFAVRMRAWTERLRQLLMPAASETIPRVREAMRRFDQRGFYSGAAIRRILAAAPADELDSVGRAISHFACIDEPTWNVEPCVTTAGSQALPRLIERAFGGAIPAADVAAHLVAYLAAEKAYLRMFVKHQRAMHAALAHPMPSEATGTDLSMIYGPTLRDVIDESAGLHTQNEIGRTVTQARNLRDAPTHFDFLEYFG